MWVKLSAGTVYRSAVVRNRELLPQYILIIGINGFGVQNYNSFPSNKNIYTSTNFRWRTIFNSALKDCGYNSAIIST